MFRVLEQFPGKLFIFNAADNFLCRGRRPNSTDGTNFTTFQSSTIPSGTPVAVNVNLLSVSAINNQPTVYFRVLGSGGSNASGTFRIDNFQVQALRPTAAESDISGRVVNAGGKAIANAVLMLSGNSLNEPVYVRTNSFGYYKFNNLSSGETYVVSISSKTYNFDNPSRVISLQSNFTTADFRSNR